MEITEAMETFRNGSVHKMEMEYEEEVSVEVIGSAIQNRKIGKESFTVLSVNFLHRETGNEYTIDYEVV